MAPLVSHKGSAVQQALVKRGGEGWSEERVPTAASGLCVHSPPPNTGTHVPRSPRSR